MKQVSENSSDREILFEILKNLQRIERKLRDNSKPTLASIGFMTNDEFMAMLNIKRGKAAQLRNSGAIRYCKMQGLIVYKISDVVEMLNAHFTRK